ncbi:MAG: zf-HC2 domain-containing protein [Deltaproteobacteria bacterium]|nr:zf-HC2 domain-containing protein [Deltaproteobacteria bacterium]
MRTKCPDEERLADYLEGRLSEKEKSHVEEHLAGCEICLEGLAVTSRLMQNRDRFELDHVSNEVTEAAVRLVTSQTVMTQDSLMKKLKGSVRNIGSAISDVLCPRQGWRPATVRGSRTVVSDDCVSLKVSFEKVETEIEIEKTGSSSAHVRVKPHKAGKYRGVLRITLKQGKREVASYLLDGLYVLFEAIPFGHYSISLTKKGVSLGTYIFEVKGSHREIGRGRR